MKLTVKTLSGTRFEIRVQHNDTIMAVKKNIEEIQGKDSYPRGHQLLIHNGKLLNNESTLDENQVSEDGFLVLIKSKASASSGASSAQPSSTPVTSQAPPVAQPQATQAQVRSTTTSQPERPPAETPSSTVDLIASDLLSRSNLDAIRAAYNNLGRAMDYLYSGIPMKAEVSVPVDGQGANTTDTTPGKTDFSGIPNTAPLDLSPQGASHAGGVAGVGSLDFLRNNQQAKASYESAYQGASSRFFIRAPRLSRRRRSNPSSNYLAGRGEALVIHCSSHRFRSRACVSLDYCQSITAPFHPVVRSYAYTHRTRTVRT
ncbi:ubiquitin receptor RAD23b-like [Triticum dicoccoides]|uniref:ubiquitin receptor RAD23b-like n=1 Tax=Triticum dicoccoides TaxID=85692 RepID=UPI00188EABE0|nr:ubiquitin receptor RAD23b-like [Triticum dicoccoides]